MEFLDFCKEPLDSSSEFVIQKPNAKNTKFNFEQSNFSEEAISQIQTDADAITKQIRKQREDINKVLNELTNKNKEKQNQFQLLMQKETQTFQDNFQQKKESLIAMVEKKFQANKLDFDKDQKILKYLLKQVENLTELLNQVDKQCKLANGNLESQLKTNKNLQQQINQIQAQLGSNQPQLSQQNNSSERSSSNVLKSLELTPLTQKDVEDKSSNEKSFKINETNSKESSKDLSQQLAHENQRKQQEMPQ